MIVCRVGVLRGASGAVRQAQEVPHRHAHGRGRASQCHRALHPGEDSRHHRGREQGQEG